MYSAGWISPLWVSRMPLHVWPRPTTVGLLSPEVWFISPMSFTCAPVHLALAHISRTSITRSLAFTPMSYTYALAHLVFQNSWTGVPRSLDFASIGFPYAPAQGHAAPARLFFAQRVLTGVLSRLDFTPMGFTYAPTHFDWAHRSGTGAPRNSVYHPHGFHLCPCAFSLS